uniref:Uncharacterized protein n=1 Tax=Plectus sambesii TaxID=2011161 RepID=A0A914UV76_9BILA
MISAEEMPAEMSKERDELNQPKNRQSLQPFYSNVIAYLANHAKIDKNGILEWLKDQMRPAPGMIDLLSMAIESPNIDVAIFSDSNNLFIETLLEHWNIPTESITIIANGVTSMTTADGLEYIALTDHSAKKIDCRYCRSNLCKGTILKELKKTKKYTRTVVVGDGEGDVCMALHGNTSADDYICARRPRHSNSSASLLSSSSLSSRAMSGLQLSLCKIDVASELSRGPSKNLGLKPAIDTNQLIYTDGRQLLRLFSLPLPLDDSSGEPLNIPDVVSVYDIKLDLIEKEKERQKTDKVAAKRSVSDTETPKKVSQLDEQLADPVK